MMKTRFAPSPTGFLHVGGARTALFNWLYARRLGGKFILRIEDTDQVRSTAESAAGILQDLLWLGLNWDEGPQVGGGKNEYFQSMRLTTYEELIQKLLKDGQAYECYETPEQLAAMRATFDKAKRPFRYRRAMPGRAPRTEGPTVIRFDMPYEDITIHDAILGPVTVRADEHDDIIIRKSDGFPTYHFAVVADDHSMGVTHVLRAQEHLMNTPKHLALYRAFGWEPPTYAHTPLVFNMDSTKMSKRDKTRVARAGLQAYAKRTVDEDYSKLAVVAKVSLDQIQAFMTKKVDDTALAATLAGAIGLDLPEIDVQDFRRSGYMADALLNFIALIGWAPGENRELLSRQEMLNLFSVETIGKTNGRFDRKKLTWMNGEYIRKASMDELLAALKSFIEVTDYPLKATSDAVLRELLIMYKDRMATFAEMAKNSAFFFQEPVYDEKALNKFVRTQEGLAFLQQLYPILAAVEDWRKETLTPAMEQILSLGEKKGAAAQAMRVAISGGAVSPPLLETIALLGRDKTLSRLKAFIPSH